MNWRRDGSVVAGLAVVAAAVALAMRGCGDVVVPAEAPEPRAISSETDEPATVKSKPRRAEAPPEEPVAAPTTQSHGDPFLVDGWPAAQVIVLHPDGRPAAGATVYVHSAGADTPDNFNLVPRWNADREGRANVVAPEPGRYDVGAVLGPGFGVLVTGVELPARAPLELRLPTLTELAVRYEPNTPKSTLYVRLASSERVRPLPGRNETKYVSYGIAPPLPTALQVPAGVPLRIWSDPGVVMEPFEFEITAPGEIAVRPDGSRLVDFEFVFTGAAPPEDASAECELRVWMHGDTTREPLNLITRIWPGKVPPRPRAQFLCPPAHVEIRWEVPGNGRRSTWVNVTRPPEGERYVIEVPIVTWEPLIDALEVRVTGAGTEQARVVTEREWGWCSEGSATRLAHRGASHVAGFLPRSGRPILAADPRPVAPGLAADLVLVPAGRVRVLLERPAAVSIAWQLTVERADGLPVVVANPAGRNGPVLTPRFDLGISATEIGPFPAGDLELVFRLAGRELGRRRVTVVAGAVTEIACPPIVSPEMR